MVIKPLHAEFEQAPAELQVPNPIPADAEIAKAITPTNADLLKLAAKYPPPAEWQDADDVDSFFGGE